MKCVSTANNVPRSYAAGRQDHSQRQTVVGSGAPIVTQGPVRQSSYSLAHI